MNTPTEQFRTLMNTPKTNLSLSQAAKETGKSKSVISDALKSGKISYLSKDNTGYQIDPAELFRVYPPVEQQNASKERPRTPENAPESFTEHLLESKERENALLRKQIDHLQSDCDDWKKQAQTLLLTHTPETPEPVPDKTSNRAALVQYSMIAAMLLICVALAILFFNISELGTSFRELGIITD